ncbi:MAG: hypothetical protein EOS73_35185, partial [Mesorhizobium sp.]
VERLLATLADREDKLDRRQKELARMRERSKSEDSAPALRLVGKGGDVARSDDLDKAIAKLDSDREQLEARLTALARENKRLKADLTALAASKATDSSSALREQMNALAAEVVHLTAKLEGPGS